MINAKQFARQSRVESRQRCTSSPARFLFFDSMPAPLATLPTDSLDMFRLNVIAFSASALSLSLLLSFWLFLVFLHLLLPSAHFECKAKEKPNKVNRKWQFNRKEKLYYSISLRFVYLCKKYVYTICCCSAATLFC